MIRNHFYYANPKKKVIKPIISNTENTKSINIPKSESFADRVLEYLKSFPAL
jgi:hypothetical protein